MKSFACCDIGIDCQWRTEALNEEILLQMIAEHARREHGVQVITPDLLEQVRQAICDIGNPASYQESTIL